MRIVKAFLPGSHHSDSSPSRADHYKWGPQPGEHRAVPPDALAASVERSGRQAAAAQRNEVWANAKGRVEGLDGTGGASAKLGATGGFNDRSARPSTLPAGLATHMDTGWQHTRPDLLGGAQGRMADRARDARLWEPTQSAPGGFAVTEFSTHDRPRTIGVGGFMPTTFNPGQRDQIEMGWANTTMTHSVASPPVSKPEATGSALPPLRGAKATRGLAPLSSSAPADSLVQPVRRRPNPFTPQ